LPKQTTHKVFFSFFSLTTLAFASETNGTIDSTYKYAWGQTLGWLNFDCENCNVNVTDTGLTGYVWSTQYGWINLTPALSGVMNNGEGVLTGSAWGKNIGWIDFAGVTINSNGEFMGYATVKADGSVVSFNCANTSSCSTADFKVQTDWRPVSSRTLPPGGGGVVPPTPPPPVVPPTPPPGVPPGSISPPGLPLIISSSISSLIRVFPTVVATISKTIKPTVTFAQKVTKKPATKIVEGVAVIVPVAVSMVVLISAFLAGLPMLNYLFYLLVVLAQILGIKKNPKPWGTVYDSVTKRPIAFARVEILNEQSRKLQSVIADENGRYGFLVSGQPATNSNIQLRAFRTKYTFPSKEGPTTIERELYPNIYQGGAINIKDDLTNFDLPMDPVDKSISHSFYFGIVSVKINNFLTHVANILFILGIIFGITNVIINTSGTSFAILAVIMLTYIFRNSGFKFKPFGLTIDEETKRAIPFGFVALHNQNGNRLNFTVSDDKGRYFLLTGKGLYTLKAYTPAHILPPRIKELPIFTTKGWISKEIEI